MYKKNKQQVYLFDLGEKKEGSLKEARDWSKSEALLPEGWSRWWQDYLTRPLVSRAGAKRGEAMLHCGLKEAPGILS